MKNLKMALMAITLVFVCFGCARTRFLPKGEYIEVERDGKTAYVQKLFVAEF